MTWRTEWTTEQRSSGGIYHHSGKRGNYAPILNETIGPDSQEGWSARQDDLWDDTLAMLHRTADHAAWCKITIKQPKWIVDDYEWQECVAARCLIPGRMVGRLNQHFEEIEDFIAESCVETVANWYGGAWMFKADKDAIFFKLRFQGMLQPYVSSFM